MARLEELTRDAVVQGVLADGPVTVVDVRWIGSDATELTYKSTPLVAQLERRRVTGGTEPDGAIRMERLF